MINFRYHIVSLAAVLFALAAGVVLGAGVLHDHDANTIESQVASDISPQLVGFDAGFAAIAADGLIKDKLDKKTVLVVSLPNSREAEVDGILEDLQTAGAETTGHIRFTNELLNPSKKQFVEGIANNANPGGDSSRGSYGLIGSTLATAYLDKKSRDAGEKAETIRASFVEGKLIENVVEPGKKAQLVVFISGAADANSSGQGDVLALIADEMDRAANGVVVAGPVSSGEKGIVRDVRASNASSRVSTVDVTDLATGRITTVLALIHEAQGKGGSWGTTRSADGPVPQ